MVATSAAKISFRPFRVPLLFVFRPRADTSLFYTDINNAEAWWNICKLWPLEQLIQLPESSLSWPRYTPSHLLCRRRVSSLRASPYIGQRAGRLQDDRQFLSTFCPLCPAQAQQPTLGLDANESLSSGAMSGRMLGTCIIYRAVVVCTAVVPLRRDI